MACGVLLSRFVSHADHNNNWQRQRYNKKEELEEKTIHPHYTHKDVDDPSRSLHNMDSPHFEGFMRRNQCKVLYISNIKALDH